jgi:hypothetical protein
MALVSDPAAEDSLDSGAAVDPPLSRVAADAVSWLRSFAAERGESVALINHLGRSGARIVAIGPDGTYGDAVVESVAAAEDVCRRAGIPTAHWDRETSAKLVLTPADRTKMAGSGR